MHAHTIITVYVVVDYISGGPVNSSGDLPQVNGYICAVQ